MEFVITYPDYHTKAYTMSYDDGTHQDIRIMEECRKYGMGCTFAINTGFLTGRVDRFHHLGYDVELHRATEEGLARQYQGFEIAGHSHTHPNLAEISPEKWESEIHQSQQKLSALAGYPVVGFTYPCNSYSDALTEAMRAYGVAYSRTTDATFGFDIPKDFLKWHPTCHDHDREVLGLVDQCAADKSQHLQVFYVWGHAYEFDKPDVHQKGGKTGTRWDDFEILLKKVHDTHAFWYGTNGQVYDYLTAAAQVEVGEKEVVNRSRSVIYGLLGGVKTVLQPGERKTLF